jgi:hypothetical protein
MIGHAIGRACDHPAASSSMCVFIPRPDRPPAPLTRLSHTRSRRLPRPLAAPSGQPPPQPPLSQGAAATVGNNLSTDNAAAPPSPAHPRLCHHRRPSPLLQTAPAASLTRPQTAPTRGRRKAHGGLGWHRMCATRQGHVRFTVANYVIWVVAKLCWFKIFFKTYASDI